MAEIKLIAGLGNPGKEYVGTRHNIGFEVIDKLGEVLGIEVGKKKFGAYFGEELFAVKKLILLKPWEYMNRSGQAVATVFGYYKLRIDELLVISDDMALEPGQIRLRAKGSAGGHKGLADIITKLGTEDFNRLRVGIGQSRDMSDVDYVLAKADGQQRPLLDEAVERAKEAVLCWIEKGIETAMNEFNEFRN